MAGKLTHGIETCEDCKKLFLLFLDTSRETESLTFHFNKMLEKCKKTIDPKYSPPRLQRHLKGLEGSFVKKNKKGKLKGSYSLILPNMDLDITRLEIEENIEKLHGLRLKHVIDLIMRLYKFVALEQVIADIESLLNRHTPQEYSVKMIILRNLAALKREQYSLAMKNHPEKEYLEALNELKDERNKIFQ